MVTAYDETHPDFDPMWKEWSLRVDDGGNLIPQGQESDTDWFARPMPAFTYGGTIIGLPDEMLARNPDLKPTESPPEKCDEYLAKTRDMMFFLAQTPGRQKIDMFDAAGMTLKVHPDLTRGQGADAVCDQTSKNLYMHPRLFEKLSGIGCAGHELDHVEKNQRIPAHVENGVEVPEEPGFLYDYSDTLNAAIAMADIQEPAARAMSWLVRASFLFNQPGDHPRRWKPEGYETLLDKEDPSPVDLAIKAAVVHAGRHLEEGHPEKFLREVFLAERENTNSSIFYHRTALQTFIDYATPPKEGCEFYGAKKKLFDARMENLMQVEYTTPERIKLRYPFLHDAEALGLHKGVLSADPDVRADYAKLQETIAALGDLPKHRPKLEIALAPVQGVSATSELATNTERMFERVGAEFPGLQAANLETPTSSPARILEWKVPADTIGPRPSQTPALQQSRAG